jgi:chromate reductase
VLAGGEAYLQFKPGLIDANDVVTDESTRGFLKSFLDQFAALVAKLAEPAKAQSAA